MISLSEKSLKVEDREVLFKSVIILKKTAIYLNKMIRLEDQTFWRWTTSLPQSQFLEVFVACAGERGLKQYGSLKWNQTTADRLT